MLELAHAYGTSHLKGQGWGYNDAKGWANYLKVVHDLGQTKKLLATSDVITNELQRPRTRRPTSPGPAQGREGVQARQGLRGDEGRGRLQDVVDRRGALPDSGRPAPFS